MVGGGVGVAPFYYLSKKILEKNKDAWTIKDDKIQFTNLNRMTEYYNLLNKLTD